MTRLRSACGASREGGAASDPAAPVPRRPLGGRWLRAALVLAAMPVAALAQDPPNDPVAARQAAQTVTQPRFKPEQIEAGREQFHRTCAQCHGRNMVNAGTTVYDLRKFPLDQPDRFLHSVTQGKGNMPSFKEALSPDQIGVLWAYVGTRGGKEP